MQTERNNLALAANIEETMTTFRCLSNSVCVNNPSDEKIFHVCYLCMRVFNTEKPKYRFASDVTFAFDFACCKRTLGHFRIDQVNTLKLRSDRAVQKAKAKSFLYCSTVAILKGK